jgi:outer membrane protein
VAQARIDYESARQDLILRVAEAYFNVLASQDTLASERATKDAIARQLEQSTRRFEVGLIAITDVKESQAAYDDAIALEIAARRALASAKEALREVTGEYPETLATPGDEFPLIPPEPLIEQDWVDVALQQNSALESAKIGVEISRSNIQIAKAGHLPTVSLSASYGDNRTEGTNVNDTTSKNIGIGFSLPIFSGGSTSSAVQEQVYLHRASRENYEKVARSTERQARDAYLGVIAEIARVRALARSVESNQTALEATEAGYDVGTRTTVDVLNSRESLFRAETQYARSKYDYLMNVLKLKQSAGTLAAADVSEIDNWLKVSEQLDVIPGRGGQPDVQMEETTVPTQPEAGSGE